MCALGECLSISEIARLISNDKVTACDIRKQMSFEGYARAYLNANSKVRKLGITRGSIRASISRSIRALRKGSFEGQLELYTRVNLMAAWGSIWRSIWWSLWGSRINATAAWGSIWGSIRGSTRWSISSSEGQFEAHCEACQGSFENPDLRNCKGHLGAQMQFLKHTLL